MNFRSELNAKGCREMKEQPTSGPEKKPRKRIFNRQQKVEPKDQNNKKLPIDDLTRYVEAELDFYKDDWEENRSTYVPVQSDFPGATPN